MRRSPHFVQTDTPASVMWMLPPRKRLDALRTHADRWIVLGDVEAKFFGWLKHVAGEREVGDGLGRCCRRARGRGRAVIAIVLIGRLHRKASPPAQDSR
jgi:hypothetical protein